MPDNEAEVKKKRSPRKKKAEAEVPAEETDAAPAKGGALVIVESPTKAKTIGKYLGKGYTVKATVGHLRDLPKRELGVDVENNFTPKYVTIKEKAKTLAEIKKAAKAADQVLLATDPDREGEAIAWHVASQLNGAANGKIRRVLFHEITKDAVSEALANPLDIDQRKVDAQQARRVLDRLVGYKASPVLWKSIKTGLSAGRVQTVALRLIIEREEEIRNFVPQEYWTIAADLEKDGQPFQARLQKLGGHKPEIKSEKDAKAIVAEVEKLPFVVTDVSTGERRRKAPAPFTTSTMQQEAAKQLGFSAGRTMRAAQKLYEGIELGDQGSVGLITYMRTDSVRVSDAAIKQAREYINAQFDKRYLPDQPNEHKGGRGSKVQGAHEAIRPTEVGLKPEDIKKYLERDLFKLYQLIWRRFLASQMNPAIYEATKVDFDLADGKFLFRATGSRVVFDGYHAVYQEAYEAEDAKTLGSLEPIPPLKNGDRANLKQVVPSQHFTEPPPRYSEASLVKELERLGIGRPSTYAAIISTLRTRWYATAKDRRFQPTPQGEIVWKVLKRSFPEVFEVGFTAQMENELDKVEEGDLAWQDVLGEFWKPFNLALEAVDINKIIHEVHDLSGVESEKCPKCGSPLEVKSGRFGPYIACVRYASKECDYSRSIKKDKVPDRPSDEICKECGAPMVIKTGRFGEFLACTRYPKCKYTQPVPLGIKCPKCGVGDLAERRTKRGRTFYGCLRYPDCDYSTWNKPVAVPCPSCGFVGMEELKSKTTGETTRKCLKCGHQVTVESESPEAEEVAS
ncbi:MAG TPA: type I DNA topoisomerase [Gemmatimonadales bacterium]|nr:type I DNA topoisomerase [Gemmatimonadales bacterium]